MSKIGIIYNDAKPIACRITNELKDKLKADGYDVHIAVGAQGILGSPNLKHPVCHTPIAVSYTHLTLPTISRV